MLAWDCMSNLLTIEIRSEVSGFLHHSFSLSNSEGNAFLLRKGATRLNATVGAHRAHSALPRAEKKIKSTYAIRLSTSALHSFHSKKYQHLPGI